MSATFAADIEEALDGEAVEAVTIGPHGVGAWYKADEDDGWLTPDSDRYIPAALRGPALSWDEARPLLDYAYDSGFGGSDCHPVWIWTATRVLFVGEYDGSTTVDAVPRHPKAGQPAFT